MAEDTENHTIQHGECVGRGGGAENRASRPLLSCQLEAGVGGGRARGESKYVLALNATCMHVDVSFSYLCSAATASFDIKKFHRNCTVTNKKISHYPAGITKFPMMVLVPFVPTLGR